MGRKLLAGLTFALLFQGAALAAPDNWQTHFDPKGRFTMQLPQSSVPLDINDAGIGARIFLPEGPEDSAGILVMAIPVDSTYSLDDCFQEVKKALGKSFNSKVYSEYSLVTEADTNITDHPAKTLVAHYRYKAKNPKKPNPEQIQLHYTLIDDENLYTIVCTSEADHFSTYEGIFKEAIESIHYMRKPPVVKGEDGPG